jgi:hypothetical protein
MSDMQKKVARWTTADIQPAKNGGFVCYGDYLTLERELAAERAKVARLREALQIIAGQRPCVDNLLSNSDIAHLALKEGA